jgi:hypothetical protein
VSDIVAFLTARTDEEHAAALAAQQTDPAPWTADISTVGASPTDHDGPDGSGLVIASNGIPLWDCEGSNTLCMAAPAAQHIVLHDPARVLRDVVAKREVIGLYLAAKAALEASDGTILAGAAKLNLRAYGNALRALAAADADHPDYNPTWDLASG